MSTYASKSHLFPEVPEALFQGAWQLHGKTGVGCGFFVCFFFLERDEVWSYRSKSSNTVYRFWPQLFSSTPNFWKQKCAVNESGSLQRANPDTCKM